MAGRPIGPVPPHGSRARYQSRQAPCRCGDCRRANADDQAARRAGVAPVRYRQPVPRWRDEDPVDVDDAGWRPRSFASVVAELRTGLR